MKEGMLFGVKFVVVMVFLVGAAFFVHSVFPATGYSVYEVENSNGIKCTDGDGQGYGGRFEKSEVVRTMPNVRNPSVYWDHCRASSELREYSCSSSARARSNLYRCTYGCNDGACICNSDEDCLFGTEDKPYCIEGVCVQFP
jgi:hypothetical protein